MFYSKIYIYETNFQRSIIEYLIKQDKSDSSEILVINAINHKLRIEDKEYKINFNKINGICSSISLLKELKKKDIYCEKLISTHFTGINALFLSVFFKSKHNVLIDDGVGTPVLLKNSDIFNYKLKFQIRFIIVKFLLFLNNVHIQSIKKTINNIDEYLTVYRNNKILNLPFKVNYLDFYNKKYKINHDEVCFIGAPFIDFKLCNKHEYYKFLTSVKQKYGKFKYYLHPDEQITLSLKIEGVEFIKLDQSVEEFFFKDGVPESVLGFVSSSLLNLSNSKYINSKPKFRYVKKKIYGSKYDRYYYELFEKNNIFDSRLYI